MSRNPNIIENIIFLLFIWKQDDYIPTEELLVAFPKLYLFMYFISLFPLGWYIISHELERRYLLKWKIKLYTCCILIPIVDCYYLFIDIERNYAKKYVKDKNIILVKYMNILWIE